MKDSLCIRVGADLHGHLPIVEKCDILILLGDIFPWNDHSLKSQKRWQEEVFLPWLEHQPAKEKILVGGNHDFLWEKERPRGGFHYLEDSGVRALGLSFWGTPWTPPKEASGKVWAFKKEEPELKKAFSKIDKSADILLSHGPPWGIGDWTGNRHGGSQAMLGAINKVKPPLFLCGHIHECTGPVIYRKTVILNATLGRKNANLWQIDWSDTGIFWKRP